MDRRAITPRTGWEQKVESVGLTYHHTVSPAGAKHLYWDESACYHFSSSEIESKSTISVPFGISRKKANPHSPLVSPDRSRLLNWWKLPISSLHCSNASPI